MRRLLAIALVVVSVGVLGFFSLGAGDDGGVYRVRAIFDNAGFAIPGMDVKIAGVKVGAIDSLDVTKNKKAAMVLAIEEKGYQDWRTDATCRVRPQSLIGEKFIECLPTQPRAAGEQAPPPLTEIQEGDGEGQRLLPSSQTSGAVDLDLINNIMRLPYRERFTIILNEFGVGLAGNGAGLQRALKKTDPALKSLSDVLEILAKQNKTLVALAENGDEALRPLARDRERVARFIRSSGETAAATAERSADFEENWRLFPDFLRELGPTMDELGSFSDALAPIVADLGGATSSLNTFVTGTPAFTAASTPALESLGETTEVGGPALQKSLPLVQQLGKLGQKSVSLTRNLGDLLLSTREQGGVENLANFIYLFAGSMNGYDQFGHYLRARLVLGTCQTYVEKPSGSSSCWSFFSKDLGAVDTPAFQPSSASKSSTASAAATPVSASAAPKASTKVRIPAALLPGDSGKAKPAAAKAASTATRDERAVQSLLDYLLG
jgi:ABC-type transporter Mla subunit MlaD